MSKKEFRPIYHLHASDISKEMVSETLKEEEKPDCENLEAFYKAQIEQLTKEIGGLKAKVEGLEAEKRKLKEEKEALLKSLEEKSRLENMLNDLYRKLTELLKVAESRVREEALNMIVEILKKLLIVDYLPKEEALKKALSEVLNSGIELRGQVNLYLNPEDFKRMGPYLEKLKEAMGNGFSLNTLVKGELMSGEFLLETPKLWIERRYELVLEDLLEDLRDGGELQDLS